MTSTDHAHPSGPLGALEAENTVSGRRGLVDAEAAAAFLSVPKSWVLSEARADRVPHVRLGRYVRFDLDDLEAWWRARRRGPGARTGLGPVSGDGRAA